MLLIENLIVSVIDAIREEYANIYLGVVYLLVVGRVGVAHIVLGEGLGLRVLFVDREASGEVGRVGESIIPYGHLVEVATLVERDDAMLYHVLFGSLW